MFAFLPLTSQAEESSSIINESDDVIVSRSVVQGRLNGAASTSNQTIPPTHEITPGKDTVAVQHETSNRLSKLAPDDLVAGGLAVYRKQYCGICHILDTANSVGVYGPTHNGMGTTAAQRVRDPGFTGSASTAEEYILESIVDPLAYVVPGYEGTRSQMPAYTNLSDREINALVKFLLQEH